MFYTKQRSFFIKYFTYLSDEQSHKPKVQVSKVVALTKNGKHIVWQQAIRSCVPTAISMIALDRGKTFLAQEITYSVTSNETMPQVHEKGGI